jgi:hypothetical protein
MMGLTMPRHSRVYAEGLLYYVITDGNQINMQPDQTPLIARHAART